MWVIFVSLILHFTLLPDSLYAAERPKMQLGLNLAGITDHASQWVFTNAFFASRPWTGEKNGISGYYQDTLNIDENGWIRRLNPDETVFSLMFVDIGKNYPKGQYLLTYDGEGVLQYKWNVFARRRGKGYDVLDVKPDDAGIEVRITATNPLNPIRNMRLMMPGYWHQNDVNPFHPLFLNKVKDFSIYRFMDWQETNNSKINSWPQRSQVSNATFSNHKGVPLEYMILLCNIQKASPWFNIPHMADDDYVRKFAEYVKANLHPDLDIYIEYSNEVWNNLFDQHRFAVSMGRRNGLSLNDFEAYARYYSQRSIEIFLIWKNVFSGDKRLKFVMAGQIGNNWLAQEILEWKEAYKYVDAYAVAPYFGAKFCYGDEINKVKEMAFDYFKTAIQDDIRDITIKVGEQVQFLNRYRLPLYAYEAGQHLVCGYGNENDRRLNQIFDKMNRDSSMKELYLQYLQSWKKNGGNLMMIFSSVAKQSKWGRWGISENMYMGRTESPKFDAILEFMEVEQLNVQ
jgi:hypothetical protein